MRVGRHPTLCSFMTGLDWSGVVAGDSGLGLRLRLPAAARLALAGSMPGPEINVLVLLGFVAVVWPGGVVC